MARLRWRCWAAARVIESTYLFRYGDPKEGHANECLKFERELAKKIGSDHTLLVTSGTAALVCALAGMGVGPGDEVIVPAYTFIASALAETPDERKKAEVMLDEERLAA
jgi:8-amino-3,8-dideoxy-alpha-D-manno-octulosonate transaminase